ncbi:MAG: hypothetical protein HOI95_08495, partial [Chromatiales bacterium]|nr:hypothetical protein [Chromatiales bacterium]
MMHERFAEHLAPEMDRLCKAGYAMRVEEHACADHGVPQTRRRTLLVFVRTAEASPARPALSEADARRPIPCGL